MPDQEPGPADPFSELAVGAAGAHEYFVSLTAAGFTASQALYLVAAAMCGGPKPPDPGDT